MASFVLIDLCFPASLGEPHAVSERAANAGLQAVVYACDGADALPDSETIQAIANDNALSTLYPAVSVRGEGFGYVVLVPNWLDAPVLAALEEMTDPEAIETAARQAGGCAIPVCPRQGPDGHVHRTVSAPTQTSDVGTVAYVVSGSILGRDLDIEDTAASRRRVLAGTGPHGSLEDLGRFATLFQAAPKNLEALINALNGGLGLGLEIAASEGPRPKKKRRRRRNRKRRHEGDDSDSSEAPADSPTEPGDASD